jgi:hypothetical protein
VPEKVRQANAQAAASKYAPKPDGSTLTYGLIAVSVLAVALAIYGRFYDVDMLSEPVALVLAGIAAFVFGAGIRLRLQQRHTAAYRAEYALRQRASTGAGQVEKARLTPESAEIPR